MTILIFVFEINLGSLAAFLTGIICGTILTILIGTLITLTKIKKERILIDNLTDNVELEEVKSDIEKTKELYKLMLKENKEVSFNQILNINVQLVRQIASRFYPKAKEPLAELTFSELSLLIKYILNKLDQMMDKGPLKIVNKIKLSWVLQIINAKNKVDSTAVVKTAKKYKLGKIGKAISTTLQFLNPVMWIRRLVFDPSVSLITKRIVFVIIEQIGIETYQVYSKQAFLDPIEEKEFQKMLDSIDAQEAIEVE